MIEKVVIFDFDGTLCWTPGLEECRKVWLEKTGNVWPYVGSWGRKESLDLDIFHIPVNPFVYKKYLEAIADTNTYTVLATGRLLKLRREVEKVLNLNNLSFDQVEFNPGMDTFRFKSQLFENLINKYRPEIFTMYDDRHEHLVEFEKWARFQDCVVEIIDVTKADKTPKLINSIKLKNR